MYTVKRLVDWSTKRMSSQRAGAERPRAERAKRAERLRAAGGGMRAAGGIFPILRYRACLYRPGVLARQRDPRAAGGVPWEAP